jgi:hypothetical protein
MDPLDAAVLKAARAGPAHVDGGVRDTISKELQIGRDAVEVSISNLVTLGLLAEVPGRGWAGFTPFGREFLRTLNL